MSKSIKILIFKTDRLGDLINISPIIYNLKQHFKNIDLTIVCSKYNSQILKYYPEVTNVLIFQKSLSFFYLKYFRKLFMRKYDYLFQFDGKKNSYISSIFINSKIKCGIRFVKQKRIFNKIHNISRPNYLIQKFFNHLEFCNEDYQSKDNHKFHHLSLYLNIIKKYNINVASINHYLNYSEKNKQKIENYLHLHIDQRWDLYNSNFFKKFLNKLNEVSITKNIVITSNLGGNKFYNDLKNQTYKLKSFHFKDDVTLESLLNIILYSNTVLTVHSGLIVHAAAAFNKNIVDLVPENIYNELDRWIPLNVNYKRYNINNFIDLTLDNND